MNIIQERKWLWDCEDVQEDLLVLQNKIKEQTGLSLNKIQCFNVWYSYCDLLCANWMFVDDFKVNDIIMIYINRFKE